MSRLGLLMVLTLSSVAAAQPSTAPDPDAEQPTPTPFDQGKLNLALGFNRASTFGGSYYVAGGAVGYFVLDGVETGLGVAHQFGAGDGYPAITRLTPSLRYVAQPLVGSSPVIPYIGGFGSRYFIYDGVKDVNSVGGRVGAIYISGRLLLGLGLGVEHIVSECSANCTDYYPDITFSFSM